MSSVWGGKSAWAGMGMGEVPFSGNCFFKSSLSPDNFGKEHYV